MPSSLGSRVVLFDAAVNPESTILATATGDPRASILNIASGELIGVLHAHFSFVNGLHFAAGSVIARGYDGATTQWPPVTDS